eukprot:TRINITY_DN1722_c0_g1_i6.p1 TRINITY_DN1722_c0_g1~~TRINITY_DN1722_c0_g1_i6.p1  ORF type:complete len:635 (-),score=200.34 TRINITY_DN1722_c0_g1_i6:237-2141(-)
MDSVILHCRVLEARTLPLKPTKKGPFVQLWVDDKPLQQTEVVKKDSSSDVFFTWNQAFFLYLPVAGSTLLVKLYEDPKTLAAEARVTLEQENFVNSSPTWYPLVSSTKKEAFGDVQLAFQFYSFSRDISKKQSLVTVKGKSGKEKKLTVSLCDSFLYFFEKPGVLSGLVHLHSVEINSKKKKTIILIDNKRVYKEKSLIFETDAEKDDWLSILKTAVGYAAMSSSLEPSNNPNLKQYVSPSQQPAAAKAATKATATKGVLAPSPSVLNRSSGGKILLKGEGSSNESQEKIPTPIQPLAPTQSQQTALDFDNIDIANISDSELEKLICQTNAISFELLQQQQQQMQTENLENDLAEERFSIVPRVHQRKQRRNMKRASLFTLDTDTLQKAGLTVAPLSPTSGSSTLGDPNSISSSAPTTPPQFYVKVGEGLLKRTNTLLFKRPGSGNKFPKDNETESNKPPKPPLAPESQTLRNTSPSPSLNLSSAVVQSSHNPPPPSPSSRSSSSALDKTGSLSMKKKTRAAVSKEVFHDSPQTQQNERPKSTERERGKIKKKKEEKEDKKDKKEEDKKERKEEKEDKKEEKKEEKKEDKKEEKREDRRDRHSQTVSERSISRNRASSQRRVRDLMKKEEDNSI